MTVRHKGLYEGTTERFIEQLIENPPPIVGMDIETISLKERQPIGFGIATSPYEAWYFVAYPEQDKEIDLIKALLLNPKIKKVFHNAIFDLRNFPLIGEIDTTNIADTNVMARLLTRTHTKLLELAPEVGMVATSAGDLMGPGQTMLDVDTDTVALKCMNDCCVTLALYNKYYDKINPEYLDVEMKAIPILIDMSLVGLKVNQEDRAREEIIIRKDVEYYKQVCTEEDFNPGSPQQVGYILAKRGNFLPFTKGSRGKTRKALRTDESTLEFLDDPLAMAVLSYRKAQKLLGTYIMPLADEDRIYTEYNLDAVVGRISSSKRNLQNIPQNKRYIFMPDSGCYTTGDFSQEHLRILMHMSGDREMQRVFYEGAEDGDIHIKTAKGLNVSRKLAKTINYAIPYGATAKTISAQAKIRDIRRCSKFIDDWFRTYPDAAEWIRGAQSYGLSHGVALPTLFGREIGLQMDEYEEDIKRKAVNYPILGSDGEVMKRALIICHSHDLPMVVTMHDSITCDGDVEFPIEELESITPFNCPFVVNKTERWD